MAGTILRINFVRAVNVFVDLVTNTQDHLFLGIVTSYSHSNLYSFLFHYI